MRVFLVKRNFGLMKLPVPGGSAGNIAVFRIVADHGFNQPGGGGNPDQFLQNISTIESQRVVKISKLPLID